MERVQSMKIHWPIFLWYNFCMFINFESPVLLIYLLTYSVTYLYCYLRTCLERGREEEGKGEKHRSVASHRCPDQEPNPWRRHVPWLGMKLVTFWFIGWHSHQPSQGSLILLLIRFGQGWPLRLSTTNLWAKAFSGERRAVPCRVLSNVSGFHPPDADNAASQRWPPTEVQTLLNLSRLGRGKQNHAGWQALRDKNLGLGEKQNTET